jgi:peptidoglycan/LPS O-acetylase OafA/YrhL
MTRSLSVYLDVVRFMAAAAVFLAHLLSPPFTEGSMAWYLGQFGDAAVAIFFVLSGYVIAHVVATRERDWRSYTASRLSRLYSVALIAAVVTLALDALGAMLAPDFYASKRVLLKPPSWSGYVPSMLMINEWHAFDFGGISPGSNGPWWSLSFEATYYLLAGFILFAPAFVSVPVAIVVLALAGTTITLLMPLWWGGYALYMLGRQWRANSLWGLLLFGVGGAMLAIYPFVVWRLPPLPIPLEFGRGNYQRPLLNDYFAAVAFGIHLVGAQMALASMAKVPSAFERFARWIGRLTFPLYLLHYPMLCFIAALVPLDKAGLPYVLAVTLIVFAAVALLTPYCEKLKDSLRMLAKTNGLTARA